MILEQYSYIQSVVNMRDGGAVYQVLWSFLTPKPSPKPTKSTHRQPQEPESFPPRLYDHWSHYSTQHHAGKVVRAIIRQIRGTLRPTKATLDSSWGAYNV